MIAMPDTSRITIPIAVVALVLVVAPASTACPQGCRCSMQNTPYLTVNCSGAGLQVIPKDIPTLTRVLLLRGNRIQSLPGGRFSRLSRLKRLDLSHNPITVMTNLSFHGLSQLQNLSLAHSNLSLRAIPHDVFAPINQLRELWIQGNCDCTDLRQAVSTLRNLQILHMDAVTNKAVAPGFSNLTNLRQLTFSGDDGCCSLTNITTETFKPLRYTSLEQLDLISCDIHFVEPYSFSVLERLTSLRLTMSRELCHHGLQNVTTGLQKTNIRTFIADNICHNYLFFLEKDTLIGLRNTSLQQLTLRHNMILEVIPESISNLPRTISFLSLQWNDISNALFLDNVMLLPNLKIFYGSYQNIYTYQVLPATHSGTAARHTLSRRNNYFKSTGIEDNTPLYNEYVLGKTISLPPKLERIYASHLKLGYAVPGIAFVPSNSLRYIDISCNMLKSFDGKIYGLHYLEHLDISENTLTDIHPDVFGAMPRLKRLNIQGNRLGINMTPDPHCLRFSNQTLLEHLDLSRNNFKNFEKCTFLSLKSLKRLLLNNNALAKIDFSVENLVHLQLLDLSDNDIQYLPGITREHLDAIATVGSIFVVLLLGQNDLKCQCGPSYHFITWLTKTSLKVEYIQNQTCVYVNKSDVSINDPKTVLELLEVQCISGLVLEGCISGFFILLAVFGAVAFLYKQRWKMRYLYYIGKRVVNPYHPLEGRNIQMDIDAYISYDMDFQFENGMTMHDFVTEEVYKPLLNQGVAVRIRDQLQGGRMLHDVISDAIQRSDKVIVLMTTSYCSDFWNTFEFNMAAYEGIYTKRQVIIPIMFGDLTESDVTPEVYAFLHASNKIKVNLSSNTNIGKLVTAYIVRQLPSIEK